MSTNAPPSKKAKLAATSSPSIEANVVEHAKNAPYDRQLKTLLKKALLGGA